MSHSRGSLLIHWIVQPGLRQYPFLIRMFEPSFALLRTAILCLRGCRVYEICTKNIKYSCFPAWVAQCSLQHAMEENNS